MLFPHLENFNLQEWIDANKDDWAKRKLVRRLLWENSDYLVFVTSGDTIGELFHINPGDEIFHQLHGELHFYYITPDGDRKLMVVRPGEMFLLPANVPHAPKRPTPPCWTMVIERKRRPEEVDRFAWFCERCNHKVYEVISKHGGPGDAVADVVPPFVERGRRDLRSDKKLRTCTKCGEVMILPN
ncbi:MAG: hypothetical protein ACE10C_07665 [Candidatus Binatia bacterium]